MQFRLLFNVPQELKANYAFIAGQYLNLKLTLDGQEIRQSLLYLFFA